MSRPASDPWRGAGGPLDEGLGPLDEERAESMASEGGRSAQAYEAGEALVSPTSRRGWPWWAAVTLGAVAGFYGYRRLRRLL